MEHRIPSVLLGKVNWREKKTFSLKNIRYPSMCQTRVYLEVHSTLQLRLGYSILLTIIDKTNNFEDE